MIYKELTELHQIMCHRFCEAAKRNPKTHAVEIPECKEVMEDIKDLERIAKKYFNAEMTDYCFKTKDETRRRQTGEISRKNGCSPQERLEELVGG